MVKCEFDFCEKEATAKALVFCCDEHLKMILKTKVKSGEEIEKIKERLFKNG